VMLHRAILGSLERFIGILLEHYEGKLPLWLAPIQAVVLNIKEDAADYAAEIQAGLAQFGFRVALDVRDENVSQKIKDHSKMAVPLIIAVGAREKQSRMLSVRKLGESKAEILSMDTVLRILIEADDRGTNR